jgi:hypothetical protein
VSELTGEMTLALAEPAPPGDDLVATSAVKQRRSIAEDFGPQTFGPAPGSDGDTSDWYEGGSSGEFGG